MSAVLDRAGLDALVAALIGRGYRVVGPTVRDDAIVLAELSSGRELPDGWGVEVGPGSYRLRPRRDGAVSGYSAARPRGGRRPSLIRRRYSIPCAAIESPTISSPSACSSSISR